MNKFNFFFVPLLISLIVCNKYDGVDLMCYTNCMKKIKRTATKAQTCIVTTALLNIAKSNPLSVAKTIVSTIKGAKVAFENCEQYINQINTNREKLSDQCCQKCKNRYKKNK